MVASSEAEMEKKLVKRHLCWNGNNMGVSFDSMERSDDGQEPEWSVVERHRKKRS